MIEPGSFADLDVLRQRLSTKLVPGKEKEPDWVTALRQLALPANLALARRPPAGPLEFELWLSSLIRALADGRTAATDWMALVSLQDSLWLQLNEAQHQLQAIAGEELPARLFGQTQLDHQRHEIDVAEKSRAAHSARVDKLIAGRQKHEEATDQSQRAMANVQYNKDNDAIAGAVQIAKLVRDETTERDEDEKFSTDELIPALTEAKAALAEEVENLGNERLSVELRRQLLQDRRDRLAERLSSRALDLERRMTGVVERYLFATAALEYRAHGFAEALRAVFATASPSGLLIALTDAATFDESDRGAQLEQIELHLQKMQDWFSHLSAISRRTALAKPLSCEVDAGKYRTSALIEAPTGNAIGQLARVRGMRVVAPFATASIPCRVMLVAPTHAKQKIGDALVDMNQPSLEHTHEWSSLLQAPASAEGFWSDRSFWNACPYGEWKVELVPLYPQNAPAHLDVILEVLVDLVDNAID